MAGANAPAPTAAAGSNAAPRCAQTQAQATLVKEPVDIIMILDNSGSMDDELRSVEANINTSFAAILDQNGVDYRVIMISRHRRRDRDDTSVCITRPLSGLAQCAADKPAFSERFFHYSTEVGSRNSFDVLVDSFAPPFEDDDHEDEFGNAPKGWSDWLRVGAKKVFLEITDDDENADALSLASALIQLAPQHFGTALSDLTFVWHSITGVAEKANPTTPYLASEPVESDECDRVKNAGQTYQELSRLTGGLRFPICQFNAYDVVFRTIAQDVAKTGNIACDFEVPAAPEGETLNLDNIAVSYTPGTGAVKTTFTQAAKVGACSNDAFYVENKRVHLCPETCKGLRADAEARIDVVFTCESTITLR